MPLLPSALPPKGEARRYVANDFLNLITLPQWGRQSGGDFAAPKKEANPASLRSAAPSKGRGLRGYSLLPMEGGAPKGRRLDEDGGVKKSEGDRLKQAINESTLSTADAVLLAFPNGEG